jgi:hypothetical protein
VSATNAVDRAPTKTGWSTAFPPWNLDLLPPTSPALSVLVLVQVQVQLLLLLPLPSSALRVSRRARLTRLCPVIRSYPRSPLRATCTHILNTIRRSMSTSRRWSRRLTPHGRSPFHAQYRFPHPTPHTPHLIEQNTMHRHLVFLRVMLMPHAVPHATCHMPPASASTSASAMNARV